MGIARIYQCSRATPGLCTGTASDPQPQLVDSQSVTLTEQAAAIVVPNVVAADTVTLASDTGSVTVAGGGGNADPTLLPIASGQGGNSGAYTAFGVPSMVAGGFYDDPVTSVTVYKVTATAQEPGVTVMVPPYAEFGPHISLPWLNALGETCYTVSTLGEFGNGRFVDLNYTLMLAKGGTPAQRVFNYRNGPAPTSQLRTAFSYNLGTPRICYYLGGTTLNRYNTETNTDANTGNFPRAGMGDTQLHNDINDRWFASRINATGICYTWDSVNNVLHNWGAINDEIHMSRAGVYVWALNSTSDYRQGVLADGPPWSDVFPPAFENSHCAQPTTGFLVGPDPSTGPGPTLHYWDPDTSTWPALGSAGEGCWAHGAGQWHYDNPGGTATWVVSSSYSAGGCPNLADAIGYYRLNDTNLSLVRLLCHHYSSAIDYFAQPHATPSPDGKLVMFGSDMLGADGGNIRSFVALVPTS